MSGFYPSYLLHHGPPPVSWGRSQPAIWPAVVPDCAYPEWVQEWGWGFGFPRDLQTQVLQDSPPPPEWWDGPEHSGWTAPYTYVGADYPGKDWMEKLGQKAGDVGTAVSDWWQRLGQGISEFRPLGDAPQKAATAADAHTLAAEEARRSIADLRQRADKTLSKVDKAAKEHEETVRVVKYVMVGVAVLGGAALIYAVAK